MDDDQRSQADQRASELYPLKVPDTTSEERYIRRSIDIRTAILEFLQKNVGQIFTGDDDRSPWQDLDSQAANYARSKGGLPLCSSTTAHRWIIQLTAANEEFKVSKQSAGLVVMRRSREPR